MKVFKGHMFLLKLLDVVSVQGFANLRSILASLIIIVQQSSVQFARTILSFAWEKIKLVTVWNNLLKNSSFYTRSFDHSFYFFKEETTQILFSFIQYLFSLQADGRLNSPKTPPAAETWTPASKLPSSPRPSLFCHCKLWSAVKSHQVGQLKDKRRRKKATTDLFLFDRAERNRKDAESLSGCTCTWFTDAKGRCENSSF